MKKSARLLMIGLMLSQLALAAGKQVKVSVSGMVCSFCAQGITKKFKSEASVEAIDVKLSDKQVVLTLKENQDLSDERIKELLTDAGYNIDKIERN